jgi:methionyl-tRNA synthetase
MVLTFMADRSTFYITTPIYYVTAKPHVGSLYSTVLADIAARWQKLNGKETFLLTGTDEHGQKIAQAAQAVGKQPKEFVDGFIASYKDMWNSYHIAYNHFIRTTDPEHVKAVQLWIERLMARGDIYKATYSGWYCTPCETYLTEKEVEDQRLQGKAEPTCPSCSRATQWLSEESYFFKLSAYQDRLLKFYEEHPDFITPKERLHEVVSFVKDGLRDLSISRTTISWGIPFPDLPGEGLPEEARRAKTGQAKHVVYVWADALNNYITAVGYGQPGKEAEFKKWWPADVHVLGKDIVRFHAVYWPAFLMASELEQPKKLLVHGWIKVGDQKMSKSLGNVIDPDELLRKYGADEVRYYLARQIAVTHDSSFTITDLEQRITSDLANDLGNLVNRTLTLAHQNDLAIVTPPPAWSAAAVELRDAYWNMLQEVSHQMEQYQYHMALAALWKYINAVNAYFHAQEPWKRVKQDRVAFQEIISAVCHSLYGIAQVLSPFMPEKMKELRVLLGCSDAPHANMLEHLEERDWDFSFVLQKPYVLFKKIEINKEIMETPEKNKEVTKEETHHIGIEDLAKVQLAIGTIISAKDVEGSDKLLHLSVDFGNLGTRSVVSGVRKLISADAIVGKQAVFITNLKPRKVLGIPSEAMLFVGHATDQSSHMLFLETKVPNGSVLK